MQHQHTACTLLNHAREGISQVSMLTLHGQLQEAQWLMTTGMAATSSWHAPSRPEPRAMQADTSSLRPVLMRIEKQPEAMARRGCITRVPECDRSCFGPVRPALCCSVISAFVQLLNPHMIACTRSRSWRPTLRSSLGSCRGSTPRRLRSPRHELVALLPQLLRALPAARLVPSVLADLPCKISSRDSDWRVCT